MSVSARGRAAIAAHEAIYLFTYRDSANVLTDGIGNTAAAGYRAPKPGGRITLAQALSDFEINLRKFNDRVNRAITDPLLQHEEDALTSFDLNTGAIVKGSVDDKLNRGDRTAAMTTLRRYIHANGLVLNGLVKRRSEEARMFLSGVYPDRAILVKDSPASKGRMVNASSLPWDAKPVKADVEWPLDTPPLPAPAPVRDSGNFLIDLVLRPLWSFMKGFW